MKTERIVKATPLESTLVASWWSILGAGSDLSRTDAQCCNSHVVCQRNLPLLVSYDGELQAAARDLVDVLDPAAMALDCVGREADELCAALGELGLELRESTKLRGADRGVVLRMREENDPFVANELVEVDWALGSLGLEVGSRASQTERFGAVRHVSATQVSSIQTAQT